MSITGQKPGPIVDEFSTLGVLLLLFTVGLKLRWQSLVSKEVLAVGGIHLVGFWLFIFALLANQGFGGRAGWILAAGFGFSSTVFAVKMLEARSELTTFHGRLSVGILVLQDLVAMGLLATMGAKAPTPWAIGLLLLPLLRPVLTWLLDRSGHDELLLLMGLGLALAMAALFKAVGVSPELGALFAGVLLVGHERSGEITKRLWAVKELFLVAFFLKIGLSGFPVARDWMWVGLVILALPLKAALFFFLLLLFRLRARTAFVTSLGLATYSEFALITLVAAIQAGILETRWTSVVGMSVLVSLVLAAPLTRQIHALYDRFESVLDRFQRKGIHADDEPINLGRSTWLVLGMGRTGGAAYRTLESKGFRVVGLDADLGKVQAQIAKKRRVTYGDAEDPNLWHNLEMDRLEGVILTVPDFEAKLRATLALRARGFGGVVGSTTHHLEEDEMLLGAGCDFIFHPFAAAGEKLAETAITFTRPPAA